MIIKNATIWDINGKKEADIEVKDGTITKIDKNLSGNEIVDANGNIVMPSLVDLNVRLKDGVLNSNNLKALSGQAKSGGVGHIVINPDTTPPIDNEVTLEYAQNTTHSIKDIKIDLAINALQEDLSLSNIAILLKSGAITAYMSTKAKNDIAIKIAQYMQMYNKTLFCKAEDNSLINSGVMLEGDVSSKLGLAGIPELSEVLHVSRMIELAKHFDVSILFKSIASPRSIELIDSAKKEGVKVACEVSIHHLLCCDESCLDFNTTAKLDPPLASKDGMNKLQKALKEEKIDVLTTLHQPNSPINKEVAFYDAAYGCESLEYALALYYTKLVKSGILSMDELLKLCVKNPASYIGLDVGEINEGKKANLVIFNPDKNLTIDNKHSLYNGESIFGGIEFIL